MRPTEAGTVGGLRVLTGERSAWKYRQADPGGWFSFSLRALPNKPLELLCQWGPPTERDASFTVLADGVEIAAPTLAAEKHRHIDAIYPIPEELTRGKERITVKISGESAPLFLAQLRKRL